MNWNPFNGDEEGSHVDDIDPVDDAEIKELWD